MFGCGSVDDGAPNERLATVAATDAPKACRNHQGMRASDLPRLRPRTGDSGASWVFLNRPATALDTRTTTQPASKTTSATAAARRQKPLLPGGKWRRWIVLFRTSGLWDWKWCGRPAPRSRCRPSADQLLGALPHTGWGVMLDGSACSRIERRSDGSFASERPTQSWSNRQERRAADGRIVRRSRPRTQGGEDEQEVGESGYTTRHRRRK